MATAIIGGKEYPLPALNLKTVKKIWPLVERIQGSNNLMDLMDVATQIISHALARSDQPLTVDQIEEEMLASEIEGIKVSMEELLIDSGLLQRLPEGGTKSGEAETVPASTGTGTESSQNSSQQDAPAEIGN